MSDSWELTESEWIELREAERTMTGTHLYLLGCLARIIRKRVGVRVAPKGDA